MATVATQTTPCTYPLVGAEALLSHLRTLAAELREVSALRARTFSWAATQRERSLVADLTSKATAYSIVTGKPEPTAAELLAA